VWVGGWPPSYLRGERFGWLGGIREPLPACAARVLGVLFGGRDWGVWRAKQLGESRGRFGQQYCLAACGGQPAGINWLAAAAAAAAAAAHAAAFPASI
jgi:hypothetical protein